ncbi:hypothetical protein BKA65DRAFT_591018 [Rhexocercosporidium sp. MPI-PUGE-AT-0058]|nr:hypothetical protein BKA65DRAFT_591018 [Rhexocercosporidium sp. MPI-PUGE-AT-0058]
MATTHSSKLPLPKLLSSSSPKAHHRSLKYRHHQPTNPDPTRHPWITATRINHLLHIARTQYTTHPNLPLPLEIQLSLREEWEHIVHDSFSHFKTKMQCSECGHLVDWCGDEGVAWFLDGLREEMDRCEVEDVCKEWAERWDRGFEKMVPLLVGRLRDGCWLLRSDEGRESEEQSVVVGEGDVGAGEEDGEKPDAIEGLEALQLVGGEGFTVNGFVRYSSPLWGSVVNDPLDDNCPTEGGLVGDAMNHGYVMEDDKERLDFDDYIATEETITFDGDVGMVNDYASLEDFDSKYPTVEDHEELGQVFTDGHDGSTVSTSDCGGAEDIYGDIEGAEGCAGDGDVEVYAYSNPNVQSEDSDEASRTSEAVDGTDADDEMEIDATGGSDVQVEASDAEHYDSDADENTQVDDQMDTWASTGMDIWDAINRTAESTAGDEERDGSEEAQKFQTGRWLESWLADQSKEVFENLDQRDFDFEDLQHQFKPQKDVEIKDDMYQDPKNEESDEKYCGYEHHRQIEAGDGMETGEDVVQDADPEEGLDLGGSQRDGMHFNEAAGPDAEIEESGESQHFQKGYGAQFQGERRWQSDVSQESEEE